MAQPEDVEILVHINAPSRNSDDVRYRALTSAYLTFQACTSPSADELPGSPERRDSVAGVQHGTSIFQPSRGASTQEFFPSLRSPQASFDSVIDNANSPNTLLHVHRIGVQGGTPQTPDRTVLSPVSGETPSSVVQDSHPDVNATTPFTSPTRVLEHYLQQFPSSSEASTPQRDSPGRNTHRYGVNPGNSKSPLEPRSSVQYDGNHHVPTIPCTPGNDVPPASSIEPGNEVQPGLMLPPRKPVRKIQQKTALVLPRFDMDSDTVIQGLDTTQAARADSEPPPSKRQRQTQTTDSPQGMIRTSNDIGPQRIPHSSDQELYAPEPPTDNAKLEPNDLITEGLRKLGASLQIPKRFRPERQSRGLRPFERGYWSLDCSDWTSELRSEAWVFLANYVGGGSAGWGIWCRRDADFNTLKVYCWGHVVAHIFLVLYLASRRKILYTGATWIDGDSKTVVIMGKRT
ncbi:hypothetical protein PG994_010527 [Apiospora phragmitis]|uniref:Uncharacterized protein n=1 Tax=Apiospora phragmitis TaxID=2905665 RepID=A0ABR1TQA0_9PEZI